jgi:hypothetical protein
VLDCGDESRGFWQLGHVANGELQRKLLQLLAIGSRTEAHIIAHLAEVEDRRLHLEAGCSSLFDYCWRRLGLSENEAFHRLTAARLARHFPLIFSLIAERRIHLTAVCLLRDFLTPENHRELLAEAAGRTKLQVQELLARRFPRPDVASAIRKLPEVRGKARPSSAATESAAPAVMESVAPAVTDTAPPRAPCGAARAHAIEPRSAERYRIQLNASAQLKQKLELAAELISHSNPSGDLAAVVERALDLPIEQTQKRRFAQTKRLRRPALGSAIGPTVKTAASSHQSKAVQVRTRRGHISNATKRLVTARDGMRCSYVSPDGERCGSAKFTQIHHEKPWARGGVDTSDNLRVLCEAHNHLIAERDFGGEHVAARRQGRRRECEAWSCARRTE